MINEQTVKDIDAALKVLKERGWTQGEYESKPGGKVCLAGAIRVGVFGSVYPSLAEESADGWDRVYDVRTLVREVVDTRTVEQFNDAKSTKRRDVIKALKAARAEATKGV